ncbi:RNA 2',3'-cyclic phosphodiesterase [Trichlorobacter ammonificans]|uniref:RNA 2',3'-cyclic phosphodiesterase n=1 Tax=Trichlorobacter ammonificans TaxID=2916410 RepID=A0ABM9D8Y0_9BACT|nr:RNA 2',3'-cyclic phosphodiesterase [Trichlorobacter ammonificans]CAH2031677.1 RNA 2',3'-cyclic phosphodiesterase [Trichlorobacter ammonificans]
MRCFVAIDLPPELKDGLAALRSPLEGARWLPPEQLHLTLAFPGEIDSSTEQAVATALSAISQPPFTLTFERVGCFPHPRAPRVLWAGLRDSPELARLAAAVRQAVLSCGVVLEERAFAPHITLARLKEPRPEQVGQYLARWKTLALPPLAVTRFVLYESRLTSQGAVHSPRTVVTLCLS